MVQELRNQNLILSQSLDLHRDQVNIQKNQHAYSLRPKLSARLMGGELSFDKSNLLVDINNNGGDLLDLTYRLPKEVHIDSTALMPHARISSGSSVRMFNIFDIRNNDVIVFTYKDGLGNRYRQELKWRFGEGIEDLNFGPVIQLK